MAGAEKDCGGISKMRRVAETKGVSASRRAKDASNNAHPRDDGHPRVDRVDVRVRRSDDDAVVPGIANPPPFVDGGGAIFM